MNLIPCVPHFLSHNRPSGSAAEALGLSGAFPGFRVEGSASWAARHGTGHGTGDGKGMAKMSMGKPMEIHGRSWFDAGFVEWNLWNIHGNYGDLMRKALENLWNIIHMGIWCGKHMGNLQIYPNLYVLLGEFDEIYHIYGESTPREGENIWQY